MSPLTNFVSSAKGIRKMTTKHTGRRTVKATMVTPTSASTRTYTSSCAYEAYKTGVSPDGTIFYKDREAKLDDLMTVGY
jgi:hypothetical protein